MSAETILTLFGAKDKAGRLYLVDDRSLLPSDAHEIQELPITPERMDWNILSVQLNELLRIPVAIHVGDYHYQTTSPPDSLGADWEKGAV